jgi:polysaccharide export outer membrane protein
MFHHLMRALLAAVALCTAALPALAQSSYQIQPGDTLQFEVLEDATLNRPLLVLPDGSVSVPLVGSVRAAGRSIDDLRGSLVTSLAPNFATPPTVYLSVGQLAERRERTGGADTGPTISVFALGEVAKPGRVEVKPGTTLLQFLAESGGLTNFAATKRVQLRRTERGSGEDKLYLYNYNAVSAGGTAPSIRLQEGDVIVVPQRRLFE